MIKQFSCVLLNVLNWILPVWQGKLQAMQLMMSFDWKINSGDIRILCMCGNIERPFPVAWQSYLGLESVLKLQQTTNVWKAKGCRRMGISWNKVLEHKRQSNL